MMKTALVGVMAGIMVLAANSAMVAGKPLKV
jgi:hypothetical protein